MPELLHVARVLETNTFIFTNVASDQHCGEWGTMTSVQEGGRRQWCSQCDQQEHFNRICKPRCARARPEKTIIFTMLHRRTQVEENNYVYYEIEQSFLRLLGI